MTILDGRGASSHDRRGFAGAACALPDVDRGRLRPARTSSRPRPRFDVFADQQRHVLATGVSIVAERTGAIAGFASAWCAGTTGSSPRSSSAAIRSRAAASDQALLDAVWSDAALRRRTITDAIQPVSNALYGRRGLIPVTPAARVLGSAGRRTRAAAGARRREWRARSDRRRRLRVRPLASTTSTGCDRETHVWARDGEPVAYSYTFAGGATGPVAGSPRQTRRTHSSPRSPGPRGRWCADAGLVACARRGRTALPPAPVGDPGSALLLGRRRAAGGACDRGATRCSELTAAGSPAEPNSRPKPVRVSSRTILQMSRAAWELVFMMLILKIPIVYLGLVVWYAIRAEPEPGVDPTEYSTWRPGVRRPTARAPPGRPARHARHRTGGTRPPR